MRSLLSFSFILFFVSCVFCQTAKDFLPRNILQSKTPILRTESVTDSIYCYKQEGNSSNLIYDFRVYNRSFDDNGNVLVQVTQKHENGQWKNAQRKINSFNDQGKLVEEINQFNDPERGGWTNDSKSDFTYNINGFLTKLEFAEFDNNIWNRVFRNQYIYFNNVDPDEFIQQTFEGGFWRNKFRVFYSFDGEGRITSSLFTLWDNQVSDWANNNRTFESYDSQGRPTEIKREIWNNDAESWFNSSRTMWSYSAADETRIINEVWINQDSLWAPGDDIRLSFDENELEIERLERNFENGGYTNFFRSKKEYDDFKNLKRVDNELYINGLWSLVSFCEYYHTTTLSSTESEIVLEKSLCDLTNPLNSTTTINCPFIDKSVRLRIMNVEGKIVYDQLHNGQFTISKNLKNGNYFFTFSQENKLIETRKVIWKN